MYRPRSCSSISSLRMGRPFVAGAWARARIRSGVVSLIRRSRAGCATGSGSPYVSCSPFVRIDDEARQGLRVEVRRLLRHNVAIVGDGDDRPNRGRLEQERSVRTGPPLVDGGNRFGRRLRVGHPITAAESSRIDVQDTMEGSFEQNDVETPERVPTFLEGGLE